MREMPYLLRPKRRALWLTTTAVQGDDHPAAGVIEAGLEGGGLAIVAAEAHRHHPAVAGAELPQLRRRRVAAAVVDQQQLPLPAQPVRRGADLLVEGVHALLLVVEGDDDGEVHVRVPA